MRMKILNLYAGIGGNRKLWKDYQVTSVESEQYIADAYKRMYPQDTLIVGDAHEYLLDHFKEFDFIWSSPPCPTHSRTSTSLSGWGIYRFPDMRLYQEIIFLKHFFKGKWVVENVIPYYKPLIEPSSVIDRHSFWTNFDFVESFVGKERKDVSRATKEVLSEQHGISLPVDTKDQRKLLRNAVQPELGIFVLNQAIYSVS